MPTVAIRNGIVKSISLKITGGTPYAYLSTNGTISILDITGGRVSANLWFLKRYVPTAPINVARLPNIISGTRLPISILDRKQPINRPGTAAGVK